MLCEIKDSEKGFNFSVLLSNLEEQYMQQLITSLYDEDPEWNDAELIFQDCCKRIFDKFKKEYSRQLQRQIKEAGQIGNEEAVNKLLEEYNVLMRKQI